MKKVLILVNYDMSLYTFRLEIIKKLLEKGYEVHVSSPNGEYIKRIEDLGVFWHEANLKRHGTNIRDEIKLLCEYRKLMVEVKPNIVFGYTIKPNIYGAIVAKYLNIPFVANITGLGTAVEREGLTQKIILFLYKFAFKKVQKVFFQNEENRKLFLKHKIALNNNDLLPGSGVSLERFPYKAYPNDEIVRFAFIGRIMKEKGIEYYINTAEFIKSKYKNKNTNIEFHICGFCEPEYEGRLEQVINSGNVIYHGLIDNVSEFLENIHAIVHPTYYPEGLSNVLLEASATGRPIITTDRSGCREVVEDGVNGYMIPCKDEDSLINAIEKFLNLSVEEKEKMGRQARCKVEKEFDRNIVVDKYMKEVELL